MLTGRIKLNPINMIMQHLKLDKGGKAQAFHTNNVMRHMQRYMGKRTGTMIRQMITGTQVRTGLIRVPVPYAGVQYGGVSKSGKRINYNTSGNPLAGPKWDQRMMQAEGEKVRSELGDFIGAKVIK